MSGRDATDEGAKEPHANHPTPPEHSHHLSAGVVTIADRPSPPQARQHRHFEPNLHHLSRATTTTSTFRRNHVKERGSRLRECPGFQLSVCLSGVSARRARARGGVDVDMDGAAKLGVPLQKNFDVQRFEQW